MLVLIKKRIITLLSLSNHCTVFVDLATTIALSLILRPFTLYIYIIFTFDRTKLVAKSKKQGLDKVIHIIILL